MWIVNTYDISKKGNLMVRDKYGPFDSFEEAETWIMSTGLIMFYIDFE